MAATHDGVIFGSHKFVKMLDLVKVSPRHRFDLCGKRTRAQERVDIYFQNFLDKFGSGFVGRGNRPAMRVVNRVIGQKRGYANHKKTIMSSLFSMLLS